jgi:hypothetical protein
VRDYGAGRAVAGDAHAPGGQHPQGQAGHYPGDLQQEAVAGGDHALEVERDDGCGGDERPDEAKRADPAGAEVGDQHHGEDDKGDDQNAGVYFGTP